METGRQFGGYTLIERIGAGGMGEVWRARHLRLDRPAAVKLIRPEMLDRGEGTRQIVRRFEREARATAALTSPFTIDVYDFGVEADGTFYYAMELLNGLDLKSLVERHGPLEPARVIWLLRQACESLAEAHQMGLIHRDIKPANLFACRLGVRHDVTKVLDFGLVKAESTSEASALTGQDVLPGSPAFMAPEAIQGRPIDGRADLYALGCVACWLLTGELIFPGRRPMDLLMAHVKDTPRTLSSRTENEVPEALDALVLRLLAKSPDDRFSNAAEVARALDTCGVEPPWGEHRAARWWGRHLPTRLGATLASESSSSDRSPSESSEGVPGGEAGSAVMAQPPRDTSPDRPPLMPPTDPEARAELSNARIQVLTDLGRHFQASRLSAAEFEKRVRLADQESDLVLLEGLVADLPQLPVARPVEPQALVAQPVAERALVPVEPKPARPTTWLSVMSGHERKGRWTVPQRLRLVCLMGGAELDLREATLAPGLTEIQCVALMGGVEIIAPEGLHIEVGGTAFMGGFEQTGQSKPASPDAPWVRVTGFVMMGGVTVTTVSSADRPGASGAKSGRKGRRGRGRRFLQ